MTKQIIIYILLATCFLSACQSEYFDVKSEIDDSKEEIALTVSANDVVVSNGTTSRYDNQDSYTVFDKDDCVGLIVLDKNGNLLADNVPYKFDGSGWAFDADNDEGKQPVYYDATMSTYIVYYPYHVSANGIKDESSLRKLSTFKVRKDQNSLDAYRFSDLLVWTDDSGEAKRVLPVELKHIRNSFFLEVKLRWSLGPSNDEVLEYHPLKKALVDFKVRYGNGTTILNDTINYTFCPDTFCTDGYTCYRYILPDGDDDNDNKFDGKVTWRYTYRGESFGGECDVSPDATGVRYVQKTSADINFDKIEIFDYYSYKEINGEKYGFVMPWDAKECFKNTEEYPLIGVVFYVGQHENDLTDYSLSGIGREKCRGYVVSLSDAFLPDASDPTKQVYKHFWKNEITVLDSVLVTGRSSTNDWSGYDNLIKMRNFTENRQVVDGSVFPAAYACECYVGWDDRRGSPDNTSGWFLPTYNMLNYIMNDKKFDDSFKFIAEYVVNRVDLTLLGDDLAGYWSSTESSILFTIDKTDKDIRYYDRAYYKSKPQITSATADFKKTERFVRAVLAF